MVACDACRTRRVKCDAAERSSIGIPECTECAKKQINCTDTYIRARPKVVRSGKLITEAKRLFGSRGDVLDTSEDVSQVERNSSHSPLSIRASFKLVETELERAISQHLIEVYIEIVHPQSPIIHLAQFQENWDASGRVTSSLSPSFEALALVMQAFAARYSDHPSIVGNNAPSLVQIRESPIQDYSRYGHQRDGFCKALATKASKTVDENGTLRTASFATTGALLLLEFILNWDESYRAKGRHLMTSAVEHLRTIAEGMNVEPKEVNDAQISGGPLFWMAFCRDATCSALSGRPVCVSDNDIPMLCALASNPIIKDVRALVVSDDPQSLGGLAFVAAFNEICLALREFSTFVAGPLARRGPINAEIVRKSWSEIDIESEHSLLLRESVIRNRVSSAEVPEQWYRDLASTRCRFILAIHINLCDRLVIEEARSPETRNPAEIETLKELRFESDARFLITIRELIVLLKPCGTGLLFYSTLTAEYLPIYLSHILSIVPYEQGGSDTWTLANKMELIEDMLQILKLMSWSWGTYDLAINEGTLALEQLKQQTAVAFRSQTYTTRSIDQTFQNYSTGLLSQDVPNSQIPPLPHFQQQQQQPQQQQPYASDLLVKAQSATSLLLNAQGSSIAQSYQSAERLNSPGQPQLNTSNVPSYLDQSSLLQLASSNYNNEASSQKQFDYYPNTSNEQYNSFPISTTNTITSSSLSQQVLQQYSPLNYGSPTSPITQQSSHSDSSKSYQLDQDLQYPSQYSSNSKFDGNGDYILEEGGGM